MPHANEILTEEEITQMGNLLPPTEEFAEDYICKKQLAKYIKKISKELNRIKHHRIEETHYNLFQKVYHYNIYLKRMIPEIYRGLIVDILIEHDWYISYWEEASEHNLFYKKYEMLIHIYPRSLSLEKKIST